jgi:hypothetical protein
MHKVTKMAMGICGQAGYSTDYQLRFRTSNRQEKEDSHRQLLCILLVEIMYNGATDDPAHT